MANNGVIEPYWSRIWGSLRKHLRDDDGNLIMCYLDLAGATNQNI